MKFGKKHPWVLFYHKSTLGTYNLEMAIMRYSCIEKKYLKAQLNSAYLTLTTDKTIQKDKRKHILPKAYQGVALGILDFMGLLPW